MGAIMILMSNIGSNGSRITGITGLRGRGKRQIDIRSVELMLAAAVSPMTFCHLIIILNYCNNSLKTFVILTQKFISAFPLWIDANIKYRPKDLV
ncbi:MAG: hypothetical protein PF542_00175 [Nanoarchaeota archaeon]|jgi:hypothetical protein|nr:hypothetical protein [Nanoarchaeota archaeon]